ncbi:MAG: hypothetical protein LBF28_03155 [Rickettsiales bacterium]|jgi:hypothetical protein|nr:hypothetical protein [Rickettsiales bacterium]
MKRFISIISSLLVIPVYAEVAPIYYYEDAVEYTDDLVDKDVVDDDAARALAVQTPASAPVVPVVPTAASARAASVSRAVPAAASSANSNAATRGTSNRSVSSRTTGGSVASRSVGSGATTASRSGAPLRAGQQNVTTRRAAPATSASTARVATRSQSVGSLTQADTVGTPLYTGRVGVRASSSVGIRSASASASASTTVVDAAKVSSTMDEIAQLTDFCKAQYMSCMDDFCNVLDDNQGRCSCSANLKNYSKTETALKTATSELQEVAQKIQYIGLTKDEVSTLFSATEAEIEMQNNTDSTRLKSDMDRVKNMIIDVKSGTATAGDTGVGLDLSGMLNFDLGSSGFDLNSLFGASTSTSSISNQRGAELYKTAASRCKTSVLTSCQSQGVDISVITNSYDLEIDKQCLLYERSLDDANTNMVSTVRNAKTVLQKARLLVAQQKNSYDMRGCINALDSCMQDDFVCGSDYENCLDPTGKYIVNGAVVVGSAPGPSGGTLSGIVFNDGLYASWNYTNSSNTATSVWSTGGTIGDFIAKEITSGTVPPSSSSTNMVGYLQSKIGYVDSNGKSSGLCISVLNKCQDYTYTASNNTTYTGDNSVIRGYLERTFIQIKTKQDEILAKYAENCITDVASCLSTNNYSASTGSTAINACRSVINTCKSVTRSDSDNDIVTSATGQAICPANSTYDSTATVASAGTGTTHGIIAATAPTGKYCKCNKAGTITNGACPT